VQPVVLAFEDLHWADPTTLDVLRGIAERGALAPLFVVATTRPEFRPSWGMRSHHGTISLAPLDRAQVRDMVAELSARNALPHEVVEDVAARTGGVPLFVEEVTRLLLERGEQGGIHAIPPTLQQSLTARLDRLGPAREVAQIGAVIGRGFSYGLLRAVAGMDDAPLQAALEKLADADILLVQGSPPESDYRFKHALIQDAAYENLLRSRRQVLHRRVAEMLRDRLADTAAAEPEALAHHFTQAGMTDAAIEWWGKAGDQALRRSAFQEAISHLGKAIEMADKESGSTPRATAAGSSGERLSLQTAYSSALLQGRGMHAPETRQAFSKARELAAGPEVPSERFSIYYGLWANHYVRGELAPMREIAELILREVEARPESPEAVVAIRLNGATERFAGNYTAARSLLERAFSIFDPQRHGDQAARFAQDIGVSITAYLALVLWALGETDRAREAAEQAMARAIESKHVATIGYAHFHVAVFEMIRRDVAAAARHIEALVNLSRAHEMGMWTTYSKFLVPWSRRGADGSADSCLADMRDGIGACRSQSLANFTPFFITELAEAEAKAGELEAALATIDGVIAEIDLHGERALAAESYRVRGEILLKRDPANTVAAEEAFLSAIATAQQQKSKELRAARGAVTDQALPIGQSRRRRPCRARAGAGRFFADAGVRRGRRGASAARGARRNR
jgi:tetratricopeptide (TPR) repeat protein